MEQLQPAVIRRSVTRFDAHGSNNVEDLLAVETPVELRIGEVPIGVLMHTPGMERELAIGFCITEGIVLGPHEIADVTPVDDGQRWRVVLAPGVKIDPEQFRRSVYTTSSCGICGKASIDAVKIAARAVPDGPVLSRRLLLSLGGRLRERQAAFDATGGLHAAALFDASGTMLSSSEDIGRHNACDKAIGAAAVDHWPFGPVVLKVSGRVSFEITQKAAVAGIPVIIGVSAASSLAVELAEDLGMTVIGFSRGEDFVVYSGAWRVADR